MPMHTPAERRKHATKFGAGGKRKMKKVMHEYKEGTLRSSRGGAPSRKQALAIALSEARRERRK